MEYRGEQRWQLRTAYALYERDLIDHAIPVNSLYILVVASLSLSLVQIFTLLGSLSLQFQSDKMSLMSPSIAIPSLV